MSAISLVDADRQWFKAQVGIDVPQTPRSLSFCSHTMHSDDLMVVPDAQVDERFAGTLLVGSEGATTGRVLAANPAAAELLGVPEVELVGAPVSEVLGREGGYARVIAEGGTHRGELTLVRPDGERRWVRVSATKVGARGGPDHVILQLEDLTAVHQAQAELEQAALVDALTGLPNRRAVNAHLQALSTPGRSGHVALLFVDLDRFKAVNDTWGHDAGDGLLVETAGRIRSCLREGDLAARLGGDEFVVCCSGLSSDDQQARRDAESVAERLVEALAKPQEVAGHPVLVSGSVGIALAQAGQSGVADLLADADTAMYQAKDAGRSRWAVFDEEERERVRRRAELEIGLAAAGENGELSLVYQPIVALDTRRVVGHEVLLRWDSKLGSVSPAEFIPVAEESGIIITLGTWVLRNALAAFGAALRAGWEAPEGYVLSVNVSAWQASQDGFAELVEDLLDEHGVAAASLALEVTEGVTLGEGARAVESLVSLRALGVQVGVDDFGTGHSSLTSLKRLPATFVKVDRSFVARMLDDEDDASIVRGVVSLGTAIRLEVVAEGVEDEGTVEALDQMGCTHAQGYLFGRPGPEPWSTLTP